MLNMTTLKMEYNALSLELKKWFAMNYQLGLFNSEQLTNEHLYKSYKFYKMKVRESNVMDFEQFTLAICSIIEELSYSLFKSAQLSTNHNFEFKTLDQELNQLLNSMNEQVFKSRTILYLYEKLTNTQQNELGQYMSELIQSEEKIIKSQADPSNEQLYTFEEKQKEKSDQLIKNEIYQLITEIVTTPAYQSLHVASEHFKSKDEIENLFIMIVTNAKTNEALQYENIRLIQLLNQYKTLSTYVTGVDKVKNLTSKVENLIQKHIK